jgi:type II secretory pathway pseudopilin PulG
MIVVSIIALLAAIAIPNLLRARLAANEAAAQETLMMISTACETYAAANNGSYPDDESSLIGVTPPYLNRAYNGQTIHGYTYTLTLTANGYTLVAAPSACGTSGTKTYTVTTGGVLTEAACS